MDKTNIVYAHVFSTTKAAVNQAGCKWNRQKKLMHLVILVSSSFPVLLAHKSISPAAQQRVFTVETAGDGNAVLPGRSRHLKENQPRGRITKRTCEKGLVEEVEKGGGGKTQAGRSKGWSLHYTRERLNLRGTFTLHLIQWFSFYLLWNPLKIFFNVIVFHEASASHAGLSKPPDRESPQTPCSR